jgi:hypothetical protein
MSKTITKPVSGKTRGKPASREKLNASAGKKTAASADDELDALASEALELEAKERDQFQVNRMTYVSIVGRMSQATMKSKEGYIPGAAIGQIVTSTKEILGESTPVTVLGIFKVYGQFEPDTVDAKTKKRTQGALKRYVMPEEAVQVRGLAERAGLFADNFNVTLPNGHILRPMHWIYLYLHDLPDITNAILTLRSTGNKVAAEVAKCIQQSGAEHSTELRFTLTHQEESNEQGEWFSPLFVLEDQRNMKVQDGRFIPVKGGLSKEEIVKVVKLSTEQRRAYSECRLITRSDILSLFSPAPRKALPAGKTEYAEDEEDEAVSF